LVDRLRREFPQIRLSLPRIDPVSGNLYSFYFDGLHQIKESSWGIPEPIAGELTNPIEIDMVLVPLLAFDQTGHRVGYGQGHYDRFLTSCRKDCRRIGLSFFPPVPRIDSIEIHDERLEAVLTPDQYFQF
jgi:5-formyltetrahydrofolate cyclo-ligase